MATRSLSKPEVRRLSMELRDKGRKLPKVGYCVLVDVPRGGRTRFGREVCRDAKGYFIVGQK